MCLEISGSHDLTFRRQGQQLDDGLEQVRDAVSVCPHQERPPRAAAGGGRGEVEAGEHDLVALAQASQRLQQVGRHDGGDTMQQRSAEMHFRTEGSGYSWNQVPAGHCRLWWTDDSAIQPAQLKLFSPATPAAF